MVLAFHSIFSMYGFWLPNDPRGSGSDYIASWELFRYGPATKTTSRRSVAGRPHNQVLRQAAKLALTHAPVIFTRAQAVLAVRGFEEACVESGCTVHACAVLAEHVHLVVGRHTRDIRRIIGHLKGRATQALHGEGHFSDAERPIWGEHGWNVFLSDLAAVERAIRYVNDNPKKEGLPAQYWSFVRPYSPGS